MLVFNRNLKICYSSFQVLKCQHAKYSEITYSKYGDPLKVLSLNRNDSHVAHTRKPVNTNEVLVNMLAAPINPADINMIQGVYAIKPDLPCVPGNEGVGRLIAKGDGVTNLQIGDLVIPSRPGVGTWRTHLHCNASEVNPIPQTLDVINASMLMVNPSTAYRMLKDFVKLKPGDAIIQNGANSAVGQYVIQLAKHFDLKSVNIVRDRPNFDDLKTRLHNLGADYVISDSDLRSNSLKETMRGLSAPRLYLNCVGGRSAAELFRWMAPGGVVVTYGGMSRQPLMCPAGPLIFSDVTLRGYWMTQWYKEQKEPSARLEMWNELADLIYRNKICTPPHRLVDIDNFEEAVEQATNSQFSSEKQILKLGSF